MKNKYILKKINSRIKILFYFILCFFVFSIKTYAIEETTIIDVSNISIGENVVHNHVYESKTNSTHHWTECLICHNKQNETKHTFTTVWATGKNSCHKNNYATQTCNCGYSNTYKRPCVWTGTYTKSTNSFVHTLICSITGEDMGSNQYYKNKYGSGTLYNPYGSKNCTNSSGTKITCKNGGTCKTCGATHTKGAHSFR